MVLPAQSSHIILPFDVGIFGPLKHHSSILNAEAVCIYNRCLSNAACVGQLAKARQRAMRKANIQVGWRESGLYPFQTAEVIRNSVIPSNTPATPQRAPLGSILSENHDFIAIHRSIMTTSIKRRLTEMSTALSCKRTRLTMYKASLDNQQLLLDHPKRARTRITVANLGKHFLSTKQIHAQVVAHEASVMARKTKGKGRVARAASQCPPEHNPFM